MNASQFYRFNQSQTELLINIKSDLLPMKAGSGLYSQQSTNKLQTMTNSHNTTSTSSFNKNTSSKIFPKLGQVKRKDPPKSKNAYDIRQRISRSIQQIPQLGYIQNVTPLFVDRKTMPTTKDKTKQKNQILIQNCEENEELFNQSYQKLNKIYTNFQTQKNKSGIEEELSQILNLIRQERATVRLKLEQLEEKKNKKEYAITVETSQNTQNMILSREQKVTMDIETQTQIKEQADKIESNQTYMKLIKILEDMNINSKLILPQDIKIEQARQDSGKKYQDLKDSEIITVQKFVIKKLVQKITSLQQQSSA